MLVPALAACAVAAGCGSSGSGSSTTATVGPLAQAADVTAKAGGAQVALTGNVQESQAGLNLALSGHGSFNFTNHEGSFALSFAGLPASVLQRLGASSFAMTEVFKSGVVYMQAPFFAGKLPQGAKWIKLDLAKAGQDLGLSPSALTSGGSDPSEYLRELRATGTDVQVVGHEALRGVETTRYKASVELKKALEQQGHMSSSAASAALKRLSSVLGSQSLPVEAWVDGKGLLRKLAIKTSEKVAAVPLSLDIGIEYFNFGPTPPVNVPAASETYDATNLTSKGLAGAAGL
jgi:hypothetical protein